MDALAVRETPDEKEARQTKEQEVQALLESIEIKSGDYQIQVHIIEARDLKPENLNGNTCRSYVADT